MVANNKKIGRRPLAWRTEGAVTLTTEGGYTRTNEGGRHCNNFEQPDMPADTADATKNPSTTNATQHAGDRAHGDRTDAKWCRPEADPKN